METTQENNQTPAKRELSLIDKFTQTMSIYEQKNLAELLENSSFTPAKFKQVVITEIKKNVKLQQAFLQNPASLFASILHCAELDLSPSQMVGEFFFIPFKDTITPVLGYKGLITLLLRSNKIKKIWTEVVYENDDFIYEMGLEPKLVHIPNHDADRSNSKIKFVYACAKLEDNEVTFKVMSTKEVKGIINTLKVSNELYFNDKKDPENWMIKKVVLKQLAKTLPKQDDRLKKAISTDDNVEGGSYLVIDDNDNVRLVQGNMIGTRKNSLYNALNVKNEAELLDS
jgi:recombination protein RecT